MLHLFRNYSALIVVISSAILVSVTNFAAGKETSGFLFGYFGAENINNNPLENKMSVQANQQRSNLAMVNLGEPSMAPDPESKASDEESPINLQGQAMVSANSPVKKDPKEDGGVTIYEVQVGDNISSIASKNNLSINTILWANELDNVDSIMPGDKIFILPDDGLAYSIKKGDSLEDIAKKYKADRGKIIAYNDLPANGEIREGQEIIIPDGQKEIISPAIPAPTNVGTSGIAARPYESFSAVGKRLGAANGGGHSFPYGYCTWYVAQKRSIPWSGNAGTWLYKAKSYGYATGKVPKPGAVMVSAESWWGHVAIVESVKGSQFTVSEMNYAGFAKKSYRTLVAGSKVVKGFIYY
ncbi:MAG TPA: LysM peptidoglycan-binding domain-containing protein [Patescibacteria group bacterium]